MSREYAEQWAEYRKLVRECIWRGVSAGVVLALALFAVDTKIHYSTPLAFALFVVLLVLVVRFGSAAVDLQNWLCPRCGQPFQYRRSFIGRLDGLGKCVNCGLPRWAETDPDQALRARYANEQRGNVLGIEDPFK